MFYRVIFLIYDKRLICYVLLIYFSYQNSSLTHKLNYFTWKIENTDASEMEFIHQNFTKKFNLILSESFIGHIIILYNYTLYSSLENSLRASHDNFFCARSTHPHAALFPYCWRSERIDSRIKYPYRKSMLRNCIAANCVVTAYYTPRVCESHFS